MSPITPRRTLAVAATAALTATTLLATGAPASAWSSATDADAISLAAYPEGQPVVVDDFSRTVPGSWGSGKRATWTLSGAVATAGVASGVASLTLPTAGGSATALAPAAATDTETQVRLGLPALPAADAIDLYVVGRALDATSGYRTKIKVNSLGYVAVSLIRVSGTSAKQVAAGITTKRITAGTDLQVRMQVVGTGTTELRTKVWPVGQPEPELWDAQATDTTAALQKPGGVAFTAYAPATVGRQMVTTVDDVWSGPTGAARPLVRTLPAVGTATPDATTTGVPLGTPLTVREGDLTITTAGTVIEGLDIRGFVTVKAQNVTIRNTIVRGRPTTTARGLVVVERTGSLTIEDSELYNDQPSWYVDGLRVGGSATARRLNIHDVIDTMHLYGDQPVLLESSWLHDTLHYADDPSHDDGTHDDNIQIVKAADVTVRGNRIEGAYNAGVQITQGLGLVTNVKFTDNLMAGGGCTINVAESGKGAVTGLVIARNTFLPDSRKAGCPVIAPLTTQAVASITGNVMQDGSTFKVNRG